MPVEVEITIQPDGTFLVPRGDSCQNKLLLKLFEDIVDCEVLERFFALSDQSENIDGPSDLCG